MDEPAGDADDLRAGDSDRERVIDLLRSAHAEGRLDLLEFDERVESAWKARTYGELGRLTADLPAALPSVRPAAEPAVPPRDGRDLPEDVRSWIGVSVVTIVIWGITSIATGGLIYPWFLWVAGPWGAILLARWIGSRGARRP